jgi:hypothetical protein
VLCMLMSAVSSGNFNIFVVPEALPWLAPLPSRRPADTVDTL